MRCLVCSGMERAAAELFKVAETVPGVRPRCLAMVVRVTFSDVFFFCRIVIRRSSRDQTPWAALYYACVSKLDSLPVTVWLALDLLACLIPRSWLGLRL